PGEVWQALLALHSEGLFLPSIGVSLYRVSLGVALGVVTAVPAGIIAGSSTIGHAIMDKPIHMLRAVPFPA
ncbi:ABC transporter permease, partial [Erysipelatoclostridium ramosum]|nr:ABC transporter permease [Thomasclavelia ramosa]